MRWPASSYRSAFVSGSNKPLQDSGGMRVKVKRKCVGYRGNVSLNPKTWEVWAFGIYSCLIMHCWQSKHGVLSQSQLGRLLVVFWGNTAKRHLSYLWNQPSTALTVGEALYPEETFLSWSSDLWSGVEIQSKSGKTTGWALIPTWLPTDQRQKSIRTW